MASKSRRRRRATAHRPARPERRQEAALRREAGRGYSFADAGGSAMNATLAKPGAISRETVEQIVREIVLARSGTSSAAKNGSTKPKSDGPSELIVNISARHVHLTDEHVEILFG